MRVHQHLSNHKVQHGTATTVITPRPTFQAEAILAHLRSKTGEKKGKEKKPSKQKHHS